MSLILNIETAGAICSVAVAENGNLLTIMESDEKNSHSKMVTLFVQDVIKTAGKEFGDLDAIAVSEGPGSYTGLRIGVATAKGYCFSLGKPLIGIPTLQSMAVGMNRFLKDIKTDLPILFCPLMDARRMEVYSALFTLDNKLYRETRAEIIDEYSFSEYLENHLVIFAGDGAEKCKSFLENQPNAFFADNFRLSAASMIPLSLNRYNNRKFEDVAYFEPAYLKDFIAGKPRVKGLR